jgi:outer membrane protein TolC
MKPIFLHLFLACCIKQISDVRKQAPKRRIEDRMRLFKQTLILALSLLLPSWALPQNGKAMKLSLDEVLTMAQRHNYQIKMARGEVKRAKGGELESLSGFLPSLSISENYIKSNDPVTAFSLKLKQGIFTEQDFSLSELNNPAAVDNFTTSFQIQQPLLNLDAFYGRSAARLGAKAQEESLHRSEEAVALQVKKAYYGFLLTRDNLLAIEEAVASARAHRDEAQAAYDQGLVNKADYLLAEVRLAELQERRVTAEHQIANAEDQLKFVIGIEYENALVPTDSLGSVIGTEPASELQRPVTERSDLKALQYRLKAARRGVGMKRSAWVPRLNAFGAVEWNASEVFSKDASNWAVGFQLQWKFFQGFGILGRSKQAAAEAEIAEAHFRQAEERAGLESRKARRALESAKERMAVARTAVSQAAESHRIVSERYRQGLEKTSDVLDKEVALTNAKVRLLSAKHDYAVALSELEFALGVNREQDKI